MSKQKVLVFLLNGVVEQDSSSDYSDCSNCKYQETETCQFCRRHYDDMWEAS